LKELYISNNPNLSLLDLEHVHLDVFDYDDSNTNLIIKNADVDELKRAQMGGVKKTQSPEEDEEEETEEDSDQEDEPSQPKRQKKISYQEALVKYFEYKNMYETSTKKWLNKKLEDKKNKKSTKSKAQYPPCIKCKQSVGMTFQKDANRYLAKCGIGKQYYCDFEIELNSGDYVDFMKELQIVYQEFQENKHNLAKIKMENLFGYQDDATTTKKFQEEMRKFKMNNRYLADLLERAQDFYGTNVQKMYEMEKMERNFAEVKAEFQKFMEEYRLDSSNQSLLDDAMEFYVTKVRAQGIQINWQKYPVTEMNPISTVKEMGFVGGRDQSSSKLYQSKVMADFYSYEFEKPEVIKFEDKV
jgi:hypothetical protein